MSKTKLYSKLVAGILFANFTLYSSAICEEWHRIETNNFVINSNLNLNNSKLYAKKLEQFHFLLSALLANEYIATSDNEKFYIYIVDKQKDLGLVAPKLYKDYSGFVIPNCDERVSGFVYSNGEKLLENADLQNEEPNQGLKTLFHEYSHIFMMKNIGAVYPKWFIEGFADYYATTRINSKQSLVGAASYGRYRTLKERTRLKYADIISENNKEIEKNTNQAAFYAQSWLLTHYLQSTPENIAKFSEFLTLRSQKVDKIEAFEKAIGIDVDALDKILMNYLDNASKAKIIGFNKSMNFEIKVQSYGNRLGNLPILDGAMRACPSKDYKPELLAKIKKIASENIDSPVANEIVMRSEILGGTPQNALEYYQSRVNSNPVDAEAWFRLGQIQYFTSNNSPEKIAKSREAFFKSYKINSENAKNLFFISQTDSNPRKMNEASINAALQAYYLQPSTIKFAVNAAWALYYVDRLDEAEAIENAILSNPHGVNREAGEAFLKKIQRRRDEIAKSNSSIEKK